MARVRFPLRKAGLARSDFAICLVGLLLLGAINFPWLNSIARESSRKRMCEYNLKRIGAGLHVYHETHKTLPPAAFWSYDGLDMKEFFWDKVKPRSPEVSQMNWLQMILPALGEQILSQRFDPELQIVHPKNAGARKTEVSQFKCPSDSLNGGDNHYDLILADGTIASFARGNYAINGGGQWIFKSPGVLFNPRPNASHFFYDEAAKHFEFWGTGVAGFNRCFSFDDFQNGLSTTVAVDEIRSGVSAGDIRGAWALGQIGASVSWGHGIVGDSGAPNAVEDDSDDIIDCRMLHKKHGAEWLREQGMPCCEHCNQNQQAAARSRHEGGVNVLMMDGTVRFVSDTVDRGLWDVMHSRETPGRDLESEFTRTLNGQNKRFQEEAAPPIPRTTSVTELAEKEISNSIGMSFVRIPAGEFMMAEPNLLKEAPVNAPKHRVVITRDYYLARYEVTQAEYIRIMGPHVSFHSSEGGGRGLMESQDTFQNPVEQVTWYDAMEFCKRLSEQSEERQAQRRYRLPTEAEWEYACRAGREGAMWLSEYWDDDWDESGEIASKRLREDGVVMVTRPVGSYPANPFGLHDMCGNVFEWCSDWYGWDYYLRSPLQDPQGPALGYFRIIRGWYWVYTGPGRKDNQSTQPWRSSPYIGFRVVCEIGVDGN